MTQGNLFGGRGGGGFAGGLTSGIPKDIWFLAGIVFVTFSMRYFDSLAWIPYLLELSPAVWQSGFVWQLVTYPFVGGGLPGFWFVVGLAVLLMFGRTVFTSVGRRGFWRLLLITGLVAGLAAVCVALLTQLITGPVPRNWFILMQGQQMLMAILITAFATMNRNATILLMFVLPIQARWFIPLTVLFAFLGYLSQKDLAGFVGICTAVAFTFGWLTGWRRQDFFRTFRLQAQQTWFKLRLAWMRKRRGIHVVPKQDSSKKDPWLH